MKIFSGIILIFLGILSSIAFAEILLHFDNKYSFDAMAYSSPCSDSNLFRNSNTLGYEYIPNASKEINSFGMRDKEYSLIKPKGIYRILLLGDSITECGNWSEYVEDKLNKTGNYEILNCAIRGWGLYNYYAYMKYKALRFSPDLVLIGFCLNDVDSPSSVFVLGKSIWERNKTSFVFTLKHNGSDMNHTIVINPFLFQHSYFYRFFVSNLIFNRYFDKSLYSEMDSCEKEINFIKKQARGRVLAIVYPYLKPLDTYNEFEKKHYANTIELLDGAGIKYIDLTRFFNSYGKDIVKFRNRPNDKIHFSEEANKLKAQVIYDWLVKQLKDSKK